MVRDCWQISLLGGLQCRNGETVIERFRTRKAASLLGYLAIYPECPHPREELLDLFWPEMEAEQARINLRQALFFLRRTLEPCLNAPILIADNASVRLAPGSFDTDAGEFESAIRAANASDCMEARVRAIDLYRGELLAGFYDEWIFPERRRLEALYLNALHEAQARFGSSGEPAKAIPYALRAVQLDPCNEEFHIALMRLYAAAGDPIAISRQLDSLTKTLQDELGEAPSRQTLDAAASLIDEAKANEPIIRPQSLPEAPYMILPRRPLWRRPLAAAAAFLAVFTSALWPAISIPRNHASDHALSGYDLQVAGLRDLRQQHFGSESAADRQSARKQHAAICVSLAESAWNCWYGRNEELWLHRFTECNEELRTALKWLVENDPERAMLLSADLTRFWYVRGFPREGYRWLTDALARSPRARTVARARVLVGVAFLSPTYGAAAESKCLEAAAIFHERGDLWGEAHAIRHLGFLACSRGQFAKARAFYDDALDRFSRLRDDRGRAVTLLCLSYLSPHSGCVSRSLCSRCASESLDLFRRLANPWGVSMAFNSLGRLELDPGKSADLMRQASATYPQANGLSEKECEEQAWIAMRSHDGVKARRFTLRYLQLARDRSDKMWVAYALRNLVGMCDPKNTRTAQLFGATQSLDHQLGVDITPGLNAARNDLIAALGRSRFEAAFHEGQRWSWERAADEAATMN